MSTLDPLIVFTRTTSFRHDAAIDASVRMFRAQAAEHGFEAHTTEDPGVFDSELLDDTRVVVFANAAGTVLSESQRARFERYLRAGGGFAGIHFANGAEPDWPLFERIVGARFRSHPNVRQIQQGRMRIHDASHPSTAGLPDPWERPEEWHSYQSQPAADILVSVDTGSYDDEGTAMPDPHAISWHSTLGHGRTWYTALGHEASTYDDPLFQSHVWGGIHSVRRVTETASRSGV